MSVCATEACSILKLTESPWIRAVVEPEKQESDFSELKEAEADPIRIVAEDDGPHGIDTIDDDTLGDCKDADEGPDLRGKIVGGHYQIISRIGEGGVGVVYKARHMLLNRIVALKLLSPELRMDSKALMRFQQEARAVTSLHHPNIVKTHEFGISEDGSPFLTMEFVEGETLADLIKRDGKQTVQRSIEIVTQAGTGLIHAHASNVIHRDIKPENIVLSAPSSDTQTAKILDFGIAKMAREDGQKLTETGRIFGSPLYMSPEQCHGQKLDNRSDVYSLGCVLYELLTGAPPFRGESVVATLMAHIQAPVPDIPQDIVPAPINECVHKSLAKDPDKRYATVDQFLAALQAAAEAADDMHRGIGDLRFWRALDRKYGLDGSERDLDKISRQFLARLFLYTAVAMAIGVVAILYNAWNILEAARIADFTDDSAWSTYYDAGKRAGKLGDFFQAERLLLNAESNAEFTGHKQERILALQELQKLYASRGMGKESRRMGERISTLQASPER